MTQPKRAIPDAATTLADAIITAPTPPQVESLVPDAPFVPPTKRGATTPEPEPGEGEEPEDETEAATTVENWAVAGGTPIEGRDHERVSIPFAALGAFVDAMRGEGKAAARPSYYARRFRRFMREPRD